MVETASSIGRVTRRSTSDGPAPGTEVASVGVAELIGSEFGI